MYENEEDTEIGCAICVFMLSGIIAIIGIVCAIAVCVY